MKQLQLDRNNLKPALFESGLHLNCTTKLLQPAGGRNALIYILKHLKTCNRDLVLVLNPLRIQINTDGTSSFVFLSEAPARPLAGELRNAYCQDAF